MRGPNLTLCWHRESAGLVDDDLAAVLTGIYGSAVGCLCTYPGMVMLSCKLHMTGLRGAHPYWWRGSFFRSSLASHSVSWPQQSTAPAAAIRGRIISSIQTTF